MTESPFRQDPQQPGRRPDILRSAAPQLRADFGRNLDLASTSLLHATGPERLLAQTRLAEVRTRRQALEHQITELDSSIDSLLERARKFREEDNAGRSVTKPFTMMRTPEWVGGSPLSADDFAPGTVRGVYLNNPDHLDRTVGPKDLPKWRDRRKRTMDRYTALVRQRGALPHEPNGVNVALPEFRDGIMQQMVLDSGSLVWASPDFSRLLAGAWESFDMPEPSDWTTPTEPDGTAMSEGTIYLAQPIKLGLATTRGEQVYVRYLQWSAILHENADGTHVPLAMFYAHGWTDFSDDRIQPETYLRSQVNFPSPDRSTDAAEPTWLFDSEEDVDEAPLGPFPAPRMAAALVLAAWALLAQRNLTESETRPPTNAEKRQARKKRLPEPEPVVVVNLRREAAGRQAAVEDAAASNEAGERSGRTYTHRFMVGWPKGTWAWRACGPGRGERRQVYLAPYEKGPKGAPLILKDKVYRW